MTTTTAPVVPLRAMVPVPETVMAEPVVRFAGWLSVSAAMVLAPAPRLSVPEPLMVTVEVAPKDPVAATFEPISWFIWDKVTLPPFMTKLPGNSVPPKIPPVPVLRPSWSVPALT